MRRVTTAAVALAVGAVALGAAAEEGFELVRYTGEPAVRVGAAGVEDYEGGLVDGGDRHHGAGSSQ